MVVFVKMTLPYQAIINDARVSHDPKQNEEENAKM